MEMDSKQINEVVYYFLKKILISIVQSLIPFKSLRRKLRNKNKKPIIYCRNDRYGYGKVYMPYPMFSRQIPEIYNKDGQKVEVFFIRDSHMALPHINFDGGGGGIFWDHWNISLPVHFYTGFSMLETMGNPIKRYGWLCESQSIATKEYELFDTYLGLHKDFDLVFTFSETLLERFQNFRLLLCWFWWYGNETYNGIRDKVQITDLAYQKKDKNISMVCSEKLACKMHKVRHSFAKDALRSGKVDVFGGFNHRPMPFKSQSLEHYRYQIVVENDISPFYFTEKILDCFASMTIPIYLGATKIDKFFNMDGIITLKENSNLDSLLKTCCKEDYQSRLEAIRDNYYRLFDYNVENKILETIKERENG